VDELTNSRQTNLPPFDETEKAQWRPRERWIRIALPLAE
jgi:hypothetical protein